MVGHIILYSLFVPDLQMKFLEEKYPLDQA
jgi:hypothetical protein